MKDLFKSKKGTLAFFSLVGLVIITAISVATGSEWMDSSSFVAGVGAIMGPYMIAQGIADNGKGKALAEKNGK